MKYLLIVFLFIPNVVQASYIHDSLAKAADRVGVPYKLLKAVCQAESALNSGAYVHGDGGPKNSAFGMCQVLLSTAISYGFKDQNCYHNFNLIVTKRNYSLCKLFGPYTNAYYAARYLKYQLDRYDGSWIHAIAAYNSGTVKICKSGWVHAKGKRLYRCKKGGILNQKYVDRVLEYLTE